MEGFSLSPSEAKALVAMMRLGSATPVQLAPVTGIDRTNLYRLLENLQHRKLIRKSPGRNSVWVAADRKEIVLRLRQRVQERNRADHVALERLEGVLEHVPVAQDRAVAVVQVTDEVSNAYRYYDAVSVVTSELLVFNRGPYVGEMMMDPAVSAALARGVKSSALWQHHE
ncbi:MAG: helix-turn-helix domain-containing protein, partial [Acidimicrobiales bacterium]